MPMYPGQRFQAIMRIYYVGNVQMTLEDLPLLNLEGFEKQGSIIIREGEAGGYSYQEILQAYDTKEPGNFNVGRSVIAGMIQQEKGVVVKGEASLDPSVIQVIAFPEESRPPSFDGVLGPAGMEVSLVSSPTMDEGDTLKLSIKISDEAQPSTVHLPDLSCQPGFDGFFRLSDTPPAVETSGNSKTFVVEMRPVSASITKIPAIEFSYFDLLSKNYVVVPSQEIPIVVKSIDLPPISSSLSPVDRNWKKLLENPPFPPIFPAIAMEPPFAEGYKLYRQGEAAESVVKREKAFNRALEVFEEGLGSVKNLEVKGVLYYNIGNVFFQLERPAMAVYYYYLSMATGSSPDYAKKNLLLALKILGVKEGELSTSLSQSLLFYFTPLQGVVVEAATLRTGAGGEYPYLDRQPSLPGTLTEVYSISDDGEWLKISYDEKRAGFVEYKKIRLIPQF
jgi:hypothetical protein